MILDTNFIIDLMDGLPEAIAKQEQMQNQKENLFVCTPTIFELFTGVAKSSFPEKEKQKVREILQSQLVLELNKYSAEEAGKINGSLCKEGNPIDSEDCMIAGIALHHGEKILTRNKKHFERVKNLVVETY